MITFPSDQVGWWQADTFSTLSKKTDKQPQMSVVSPTQFIKPGRVAATATIVADRRSVASKTEYTLSLACRATRFAIMVLECDTNTKY